MYKKTNILHHKTHLKLFLRKPTIEKLVKFSFIAPPTKIFPINLWVIYVALYNKERQIQPYREENIKPDVLVGKITDYWREMFEKNKTSNDMSCKQTTSCIGMVYILWHEFFMRKLPSILIKKNWTHQPSWHVPYHTPHWKTKGFHSKTFTNILW